jgi:hypothetical protein
MQVLGSAYGAHVSAHAHALRCMFQGYGQTHRSQQGRPQEQGRKPQSLLNITVGTAGGAVTPGGAGGRQMEADGTFRHTKLADCLSRLNISLPEITCAVRHPNSNSMRQPTRNKERTCAKTLLRKHHYP